MSLSCAWTNVEQKTKTIARTNKVILFKAISLKPGLIVNACFPFLSLIYSRVASGFLLSFSLFLFASFFLVE